MRSLVIWAIAPLLLVSVPARANPLFPPEIPKYMKTSCSQPDCVLCHVSDVGQCNEIDKPFGKWLLDAGLSCANGNVFDMNAIDPYLDEAKSTQVDSNCDGVPDFTQLQQCDFAALEQDQCGLAKADGGTLAPVENTIYGCNTSGAPAGSAALSVGVGLLLLRSRSGRRPSSGRASTRCAP